MRWWRKRWVVEYRIVAGLVTLDSGRTLLNSRAQGDPDLQWRPSKLTYWRRKTAIWAASRFAADAYFRSAHPKIMETRVVRSR